MIVSEAIDILEAASVECKQTDIFTLEVREALDFLQPHTRPEWLIPQFRYHAQLNEKNEVDLDKEAQQQALRAIFPSIRESVKDLLGKQMNALARQFAANHDMKIKEEIERLSSERVKLYWP
jgi:hypothetical protein